MRDTILLICVIATLTGCKVGPNYKRPDVPVPPQFRGGGEALAHAGLAG